MVKDILNYFYFSEIRKPAYVKGSKQLPVLKKQCIPRPEKFIGMFLF